MTADSAVQDAVGKAFRTRHRIGVGLLEPANPVDAARKLGIEVRFENLPSIDGLFTKEPRLTIVLSSARPRSRQTFTCAHELGHIVLQHEPMVDLLADDYGASDTNDDEYLANVFASYLLMPKTAIQSALRVRNLKASTLTPFQQHAMANAFGVGCTTLAAHLRYGLRLIGSTDYARMTKVEPKEVRTQFAPQSRDSSLIVVDRHWRAQFVDAAVGDFLWFDAPLASPVDARINDEGPHQDGTLARALSSGFAYARTSDDRTYTIRITRAEYTGRAIYRFLGD